MARWWGGGLRKREPKRLNPETVITRQIRDLLKVMRVPHFKNFATLGTAPGVPDIIGTLPGPSVRVMPDGIVRGMPEGRGLYIEVKTPRGSLRPEQVKFLDEVEAAGAVAFVARSARDLLDHLAAVDFEPAKRIHLQFGGKTHAR
jgi:hypothetical protein